ncbi:thioredoxin family protein [Candidatus Beckwithbacteria bacterium CG10_big_fil_rev_8_21_14_0_10_34_10]|uniref:Thioredoxin family protein n=1 Tax=Candidatus Beckwithbacteria bacterium CG10_big_fil_rev_8_21_14_0_10_34_10 TaxID=1974495 RepID=A0A2H0W9W3_9BACT|nr:MAG: thioredoxin family protein [Candidatus Beckwithbacteria bacterium CG10_big_fil_rev_8_21_14_0_10_34_10]
MKIQVLGSGCATCKNLYEITKKAVNEMKLETEVEYVTGNEGTQKIIELGAMSSPVLIVNGYIAMTGFTPDGEAIKEKIKKTLEIK